MTAAIFRTKAEQALITEFEQEAPHLPGASLLAQRRAAMARFAVAGLPHRRIEEWKYTDLRVALKEALPPAVGGADKVSVQEIDGALETLAALDAYRVVFVDGVHAPDHSTVAGAKGLEIASLAAALVKSGDRTGDGMIREGAPSQEAVIALNTAFMTDGAIVRIAKGAELIKPLLLVFARSAKEGRLVTTRNIVRLAAGARATVIEAHVALPGAAPGQANEIGRASCRERV